MILTGTGIIRGVGNSVSYNVVALVPGSIFVDPTASPILTNDGVNWLTTTSVSTPTIWQVNSILYSIGYSKFVICGGKTGRCGWSYSSDGRSWTKSSTVTTREQLSLIEGNNKTIPLIYKLISLANGYVRYSTDGGVTWSTEISYSLAGGATHIPATGVFNELSGLYISAGSGTNRVMYSATGTSWTGITVGSQNFIGSVYFSNSTYNYTVIVSNGSMYYGNGITMTLGTLSGASANISTIAYSPTLGKAIAATNTTTGYISDGEGTQLVGIASLFPVVFNRIIWSTALGKWIGFATGASSAVYTSSTGLAGSWTNVYAMNDTNRAYSRAASK
jgi:hypothetical protein